MERMERMFEMQLPNQARVCEVGPRDGIQNEKKLLTLDQKVALVDRAVAAGYQVVEIGSLVHPKAVPQMAETEAVFKRIIKPEGVEFRVLTTNLKGIERAVASGIRKVKLTVSASTSHNLSNFNRTPEQTVDSFEDCVALARENGLDVSGAIGTAFGCPFEGKIETGRVLEIAKRLTGLGIRELSLSDTTGVANPRLVHDRCLALRQALPEVAWNLHFHNTRDMALANVVAGLQAGVASFDGSFSGIGGCPYAPGASGNVASEDLVHMLHEMRVGTGVDLDKAIDLAGYVRDILGHDTDSCMLKAGKASKLIDSKPTGQQKFSKA